MVAIAQLVEPWIVIPVVVGSSPISHPKRKINKIANMTKLVDVLASGVSVFNRREGSSPSFRITLLLSIYFISI